MTAPFEDVPAPVSLAKRLKQIRNAPNVDLAHVRIVSSGAYQALESRWASPNAPVNHGRTGATMEIETPRGRFDCTLMMPPGKLAQQIENWRRFCASLDIGASQEKTDRDG